MLTAKVLKLAQWAKDSSNEHVTNGFHPCSNDEFSVAWVHGVLKERFSMRKVHQACEELAESGKLLRVDFWSTKPHFEQPIERRYYQLAPEQTPQK